SPMFSLYSFTIYCVLELLKLHSFPTRRSSDLDMSNDFVADDGPLTVGKPAQDIIPYIKDLATKFLTDGNVVVVSMDAHQPNDPQDRKSTRLNSSHVKISYAVFCLKKKNENNTG